MSLDVSSLKKDRSPFPGELTLKQMCEQHGFENVRLHQRNFMEPEFPQQIKEAFTIYKQDKQSISAHLIYQNLSETQAYITSFLSNYPIRSFEDRLREELRK